MTATVALAAPFVVAAVAVTLRHKVGLWASWLFLLALVLYIGEYGQSQPVFWNRPGFLASMSEDLGAMFALINAGLFLGEWKSRRIAPVVATLLVGCLLIAIQWALARLPVSDLLLKSAFVMSFLWLLSQVYRGIRFLVRKKFPSREPAPMESRQ